MSRVLGDDHYKRVPVIELNDVKTAAKLALNFWRILHLRTSVNSVNSVQDRIDPLSCHTCAEFNNKHISKTSEDLEKNERFYGFLSRSLLCWETRSCWLCIGEVLGSVLHNYGKLLHCRKLDYK